MLAAEFGFDGTAALAVRSSGGELIVTSRTYNLLGEGNDLGLPAGATFGQYIPALAGTEALHPGDDGRLLQLAQSADPGSGARTNLVLLNATDSELAVEVELHTAAGAVLGSFERLLAPYEYRQLNRVFTLVTGDEVADGYAVVRTHTGRGAFFALASVVDNLTGDPVGMSHARVQPEGLGGFLEGVGALLDLLGRTNEDGEAVPIEQVFDLLASGGMDDVLDAAAAENEFATRTEGGLMLDYGAGHTTGDGRVISGSSTLDLSGVVTTESRISGTLVEDRSALRIDGEAPDPGWLSVALELEQDAEGRVNGTIGLDGGRAGPKQNGGEPLVTGTLEIATWMCEYFPTSGEISFFSDGSIITVVFTEECDGTFDYYVTPAPEHIYRTCRETLQAQPGAEDGVYWVDPDGPDGENYPFQSYCDMSTAGGGWTLLLNYAKAAGDNPPLTRRLPTSPEDQSHLFLVSDHGFEAADVSEVRLYCTSSEHPRVIHFTSTNPSVLGSVRTGATIPTHEIFWTPNGSVLQPDHTAFLPDTANGHWFPSGIQLFRFDFPFYESNLHHWGVKGDGANGDRWECDDFPGETLGYQNETLHQVWFR